MLLLRIGTPLKAIMHTNVNAKPDGVETTSTPLSTEPKVGETPEQQMIRWAMNNGLITKEMNLVKFLNELGWTTIDQMRDEFSSEDIPEDFPKRFRQRLMNAVRTLRNEQTNGRTETDGTVTDGTVTDGTVATEPVKKIVVINVQVTHPYPYDDFYGIYSSRLHRSRLLAEKSFASKFINVWW